MKKIIRFTYLGFYFNSIKDTGEILSIKELYSHLKEKKVFPFLKDKYGDLLDISLYESEDIAYLEEFFYQLYCCVDSERKFGVINDGLCLLIAYCLQGVQEDQG